MGPNDKNDLIWMFGKIHGLENISLLSEEQIELIKDPFTLQRAINNVKKPTKAFASYEEYLEKINEGLSKYKEAVNEQGFYPSDKQKLLALPFYLAKRKQLPTPKIGQWQYNLFTEFYGKSWSHFDHLE